MNIKKSPVLLFSFALLFFSCQKKENNHAFKCPYRHLDGSTINKSNNIEVLYNLTGGVNGKLNTNEILKKLGELELGGELKGEFKNLHKQLSSSSIEYDKEFTQNWNVLVTDICGQLNLLTSPLISSASKLEIEEKLIPKITSFSELVQNKKRQKKIEEKENPLIIEKPPVNVNSKNTSETELPIQPKNKPLSIILKKRTKGFIKVLHEGRKVNFLPNSNKYNIRIAIEDLPTSGDLIIVTALKDTCYLSLPITNLEKINRVFPQCL